MKLNPSQTLGKIAGFIGAEYVGDPDLTITGLNEIHRAEHGDIVFVDHPKYYQKAMRSKATVVLIDKLLKEKYGKSIIISEDPFRDFNRLIEKFCTKTHFADIKNERLSCGKGTVIHPSVIMGSRVRIGSRCLIYPNVVIYDGTEIGNGVVIHAGTVIGSDAFYYKNRGSHFDKLISCGHTIIGDHVEIGAQCSIDRGVTSLTIIGERSKIDNQVHIGHDTVVGKRCLFAAQVGISGAVVIEDNVTLWGQVGVCSNVTIGEGAVVLAQSGVRKSLEGNKVYFGSPAEESRTKMKEIALLKKMPQLLKKNS